MSAVGEEIGGARERLLSRKMDLLAALRQLEEDHQDGTVDGAAYLTARGRYEREAASVLRKLDELHGDVQSSTDALPTRSRGKAGLILLAACFTGVVAVLLFLVGAIHPRASGAAVTGSSGGTAPSAQAQAPPALKAAERRVLAHPRSLSALLALGNAYLADGNTAAADRTFQTAVRIAPHRPEAPTMHAMLVGASGKTVAALRILHSVETRHPRYPKAWLLDGIMSARTAGGTPRALASWRQFLRLQPRGSVAAQVRQWITATVRSARKR
jgi:cytochrome c-type biogenesis protein CcmH/NrfG